LTADDSVTSERQEEAEKLRGDTQEAPILWRGGPLAGYAHRETRATKNVPEEKATRGGENGIKKQKLRQKERDNRSGQLRGGPAPTWNEGLRRRRERTPERTRTQEVHRRKAKGTLKLHPVAYRTFCL